MKKQTATLHMIAILSALIVFHVLTLTGIIPYDIVWGGSLQNPKEMSVLETTAMLISIGMIITLLVKLRQLKNNKDKAAINYVIWGFAATFFFGAIGNLMAESPWEIIPGTTISLYATYLCVLIARNKGKNNPMKELSMFAAGVMVISACSDDDLNSNLKPAVENQQFSIEEHAEVGTSIGTIVALDPNQDEIHFSLISSDHADFFEIDPISGELTVASSDLLDYETSPSFSLNVTVSDGELADQAIITIDLIDIEEVVHIAIPDKNFEARLIDMGVDSDGAINQRILKSDAEIVTHLNIDFSSKYENVTDLTGIEGFTNLIKLSAQSQDIEAIDLSANHKLDSLNLSGNQVSNLDISNNKRLVWLNASSNGMISVNGISEAKNLKVLDLSWNDFQEITIANESLEQIYLSHNLIEKLDITGLPNLKSIMLNLNLISELDVTANALLETLLISGNRLTDINLSENSLLEVLYISSNDLRSLDVSQNQSLRDLRPDRNPNLSCIKVADRQEIAVTKLSDYQELNTSCDD